MLSSTACDSLWMPDIVSKRRPFSFIFNLGNKSKSQGLSLRRVGRMGNDNHVVFSQKLCGFQGRVCGRARCRDEEASCCCAKASVFLWHIFSQASQNVTVNVRVDRHFRRNKFTVNNPLHVEKKWMGMLLVELRTCRALLALGDCGLFYSDDCCFVSGS
jgi:hypothetical protein